MKISIDYLPEEKQTELNNIVEFLETANNTQVEMVILFGSYARDTWVEDKYNEGGTMYEYKSDYDLLFVLKNEKTARKSELIRGITRRIKKNVEVETRFSPIYHGIDYFNAELQERNYFFMDIFNEGILLYDSGIYAVESPPDELPKDTRLMKARYYYEKWLNSADGFLWGYEKYYNNKNYSLAVFHLHQTAEHLFMGIHLVYTDYKPKSHDLLDLLKRAKEFNLKFQEAFPCRTKEETELFKKLNDAYIDSRYKKDYVISSAELDYMLERVKTLQKLAETLCREFILDFSKQVNNISDELMEKIKKTDASIEGFYVDRERAKVKEQKKISSIKNENTKEVTARIAVDLLKNGVEIDTVSKSTGLTIEEIEKLR